METLAAQVEVLRLAVDELREEYAWTASNCLYQDHDTWRPELTMSFRPDEAPIEPPPRPSQPRSAQATPVRPAIVSELTKDDGTPQKQRALW